jgi:hypothetical protein
MLFFVYLDLSTMSKSIVSSQLKSALSQKSQDSPNADKDGYSTSRPARAGNIFSGPAVDIQQIERHGKDSDLQPDSCDP